MASKVVRIRDRNQVTLPPEVLAAVSLRPGDFLEVSVIQGILTLAPKRLGAWSTAEAQEAGREAERDIVEKRYRTFRNATEFAADLLDSRRASTSKRRKQPSAGDEKRTMEAPEASSGRVNRAATRLRLNRRRSSRLPNKRRPETEKP